MSAKLYAIKDRTGAHLARNLTEGENPTAEILLLGEPEAHTIGVQKITHWERVYMASVEYYQPQNKFENPIAPYPTIASLAQEAATIYNLDPMRVQRAAEIVNKSRYNVQNAQRDENGVTIDSPSLKTLIVKSESGRGWYVVTQGACTCEDHKRGNTCKHRIAAWMHREMITRAHAVARHTTPAVIFAELTQNAKTKQGQ